MLLDGQRRLIAPLSHRPVTGRSPTPTLCREKRHQMTTRTHLHGRPAEAEPESTIHTQQ